MTLALAVLGVTGVATVIAVLIDWTRELGFAEIAG